jgi:hypothetical protein
VRLQALDIDAATVPVASASPVPAANPIPSGATDSRKSSAQSDVVTASCIYPVKTGRRYTHDLKRMPNQRELLPSTSGRPPNSRCQKA